MQHPFLFSTNPNSKNWNYLDYLLMGSLSLCQLKMFWIERNVNERHQLDAAVCLWIVDELDYAGRGGRSYNWDPRERHIVLRNVCLFRARMNSRLKTNTDGESGWIAQNHLVVWHTHRMLACFACFAIDVGLCDCAHFSFLPLIQTLNIEHYDIDREQDTPIPHHNITSQQSYHIH